MKQKVVNRIYKTKLGWIAIEYRKGSQIWTEYHPKASQAAAKIAA